MLSMLAAPASLPAPSLLAARSVVFRRLFIRSSMAGSCCSLFLLGPGSSPDTEDLGNCCRSDRDSSSSWILFSNSDLVLIDRRDSDDFVLSMVCERSEERTLTWKRYQRSLSHMRHLEEVHFRTSTTYTAGESGVIRSSLRPPIKRLMDFAGSDVLSMCALSIILLRSLRSRRPYGNPGRCRGIPLVVALTT